VAAARVRLAALQAARGDEVACRATITGALETFADIEWPTMLRARAALGHLMLSAGQAAPATLELRQAQRIAAEHGVGEPGVGRFAGDLIEALIRARRIAEAELELSLVEAAAKRGGGLWTKIVWHRGRGLLAPGGAFDEPFESALAVDLDDPFEQARTLLAYGERLRRRKRRRAAEERLLHSLDGFRRLGAAGWAAHAEAGLTALSGRRTAVPNAGIRLRLTAQELRVAHLVAGGATNREIAAGLFLSPKTIENHLARIYQKLSLRSRTELAAVVLRDEARQLEA
jgi:DNA-binding CsgD family transcriptional regulator